MARVTVRRATTKDLDLLVRHRRGMWEAVSRITPRDLDLADRVYRRWARVRLRSGRLVGFIVENAGIPVASGCVWVTMVQPRPHWKGTRAAYLMSMFTEPDHRGRGHATRIVRAAERWAKARGIGVMFLHASRYGEPIYERAGYERTTEMRRFLAGPAARRRRAPRPRRESG